MESFEIYLLLFAAYLLYKFLSGWYGAIFSLWQPARHRLSRFLLGWLPVVYLPVVVYVLTVAASFDVVDSFLYIIFYTVLGYTWIYAGMLILSACLDISWRDDALNMHNKAALFTVTGGFLGLTALYAATQIGDGPGWWCVVFTGFLGMASLTVLGLVVHTLTRISERITVERDTACGIRFGFYLLACGLLLGRASAGDWTSFYQTIIEFADGWPVLPLTLVFVLIERFYISGAESESEHKPYASSVFWGAGYVLASVAAILYLPLLPQNPLYSLVSEVFLRLAV